MKKILLIILFIILASLFTLLCFAQDVSVGEKEQNQTPDYKTVFSDDVVHEIHISITPDNWQKMRDDMTEKYGKSGNRSMGNHGPPGGFGDITPDQMEQGESGAHAPGGMWDMGSDEDNPVLVPATVTENGTVWDHVGIRFKGSSSLQRSWQSGSLKISLKLDFDKYKDEFPETKGQTYHGFEKLNLQSNAGDSSFLREKVVPDIFRKAGVVAPDTAFYRVYIDYGDGPVYFGLYTLIETVDDTLIKNAF
ncbi:MAG: CotH kinase family protein, partial [Methanospirillum sp.]|uniref:CotH kinase family protein n=1 Tax=Methanospirillum sp. TaxID=45200 RepID=UPI00236BF45C